MPENQDHFSFYVQRADAKPTDSIVWSWDGTALIATDKNSGLVIGLLCRPDEKAENARSEAPSA